VAALKLQIDGKTVYEGVATAVPRVGEDINHGGQVVRIEGVVWDFTADGTVVVTLVVGDRPYAY
jgi:hypothetical protein